MRTLLERPGRVLHLLLPLTLCACLCGGPKASGQKDGPSGGASDAGKRQTLAKMNVQLQVPLRGRWFVLHTYLPAEVRPGSPLVLYASGAGGWHSFDGHVAEVLAGAS